MGEEAKQKYSRPRTDTSSLLEGWKWDRTLRVGLGKKRVEFLERIIPSARRVGVQRNFGWVSLVCIAIIDSRWGALEPRVNRLHKSNNVFLLRDTPEWDGEVLSVSFPIMLSGRMVMRKVKVKRLFTLDDCFESFIDFIDEQYGPKMRKLSFTSWKMCYKLAHLGYFVADPYKGKDTAEKRRQFVKKYVFPVRHYLITKGWLKDD